VRDSRFVDNGHLGIHVHRSETIVVERSVVVGNNKARFDPRHSAGGVKVTASTGVTVRGNVVSRNGGPGIWTDLATRLVTIAHNEVVDNGRSGIQVELTSSVNVVSNVVRGNGEAGVWVLESTDVQVAHNEVVGNSRELYVLEGPRGQIDNVALVNNVVGDDRPTRALVVDDWTSQRAAADIPVRRLANAAQRREVAAHAVSGWRSWSARAATGPELPPHGPTAFALGAVTNADDGSPGAAAVRFGVAVHGSLAAELGVAPGARAPVGPVGEPPSR